jgi:peptide/nickel transport system permease protein
MVLMVVTLFLLTVITFAVTNVLPGSVAITILGEKASEEAIAALEAQLGLDQPWYVQYLDWVGGLLVGDLGTSLRFNRPVADLIVQRFPRSAVLAVSAITVSILLSLPLGIYSALNQNRLPDVLASTFGFVGISIPSFIWAMFLILAFALNFDWLPPSGYVPFTEDPVSAVRHIILPAGSLGFILTAYIMRMTRSSMLEVLGEEYVTMARAKGMTKRVIVLRHALKNAVLPVITVIAFQFGVTFGGVVIVEEVFAYPGMGTLTLTAIENRDIPLLQGCIVVIAIVFMLSNLLADVLYAVVDPRIRFGGGD